MDLDVFFKKLASNPSSFDIDGFKFLLKKYDTTINIVEDRLSEYFIFQLYKAYCNGDILGNIISEIGRLEGQDIRTTTKKETKFRGELSGYWHKHFYSESLKAFNRNNLGYCDQNFTNNSLRLLRSSIRDRTKLSKNLFYEEQDIFLIIQNHIDSVFNSRVGQISGDWIIYKKYNNQNYYMALSQHSDQHDKNYSEDDLVILLKNICMSDFPHILK